MTKEEALREIERVAQQLAISSLSEDFRLGVRLYAALEVLDK